MAEPALAFAESGADTLLDPVDRRRAAGTADRVDDFPFRDVLAAADDPAERRVFGDVRRAVERRHPCESDAGAASGIEIGVFFQRDVVPNEIDDLFGDGQRGRQTGGLDSQKVNQAGSGPVDYELAPLFDRAKSGELADDLPGRNRGNKFLCRSENPRQGFVGGREIVLSVGELGRRPIK